MNKTSFIAPVLQTHSFFLSSRKMKSRGSFFFSFLPLCTSYPKWILFIVDYLLSQIQDGSCFLSFVLFCFFFFFSSPNLETDSSLWSPRSQLPILFLPHVSSPVRITSFEADSQQHNCRDVDKRLHVGGGSKTTLHPLRVLNKNLRGEKCL